MSGSILSGRNAIHQRPDVCHSTGSEAIVHYGAEVFRSFAKKFYGSMQLFLKPKNELQTINRIADLEYINVVFYAVANAGGEERLKV